MSVINYTGERDEEWPGPIPDLDEDWRDWWFVRTVTKEELRFLYRMTPQALTPKAAA